MRKARFFIVISLIGASLGWVIPGTSWAAGETAPVSPKTAAEAKKLRDEAFKFFEKKEYAQAVELYQKATALERKVGAMANMASALKELGRYEEALLWYETLLAEFPNAKAKTRETAEEERKLLLSKFGTIEVEGDVIKGARLFVDKRDVGELPLQAPVRVLEGMHDIRAEKPGFRPIKASIEVTGGKASIAKLVAKEREGKLEIREKHNWLMRVEIDGRDEGLTPLSKIVPVGEHRIRLRGYMQPDALLLCETPQQSVDMGARMESEEKPVTVGLFETQTVELSAEDMDASLHIESMPPGARLWIDGHDVGPTPWDKRLPLGEHAIEVRAKGYFVAKQKVTLERRKQRELSISLERVPEPPGFWTGRNVGTVAGLGVGLVGLGIFGITGGLALQNASELKDVCREGTCPKGKEGQLAETRTLGNAALAGIIVGGVGLAAGGAVWIFAAPPKEQKRETRERAGVRVRVGLGGLSAEGRF